jgi:hypothetical protein
MASFTREAGKLMRQLRKLHVGKLMKKQVFVGI